MKNPFILIWVAVAAIFATVAALVLLVVTLWPPTLVTGLLLTALFLLPLIALLALLEGRHRPPSWSLTAEAADGLTPAELAEHRLLSLSDYERRLEYRELRLARQIRTSQVSSPEFVDLLQATPTDEELDALVENDRKLVTLIEKESQLAFNRILQNRYAAEDGVNSALILQDVRDFVEQVARLYRPQSEHILLETDIELMAKSLSSATLHLLIVVDDLPLNLKSYNTAKMYGLIRRSTKYYGTYKTYRPYLEQGLNALQIARLALGVNPVAVGTAWLAGKLSTHGAKLVGERLLQRKALQLLNDFIRVIGFEAAMMYGGDFAHRDANWVFGATLVNLEISRGDDFGGRDAALRTLCHLVLRNEFDRIHLLTRLARGEPIDIKQIQSRIIMTAREREDIAKLLNEHCNDTGVDLKQPAMCAWTRDLEKSLDLEFRASNDVSATTRTPDAGSSRRKRLADWFRSLIANSRDA